MERHLLHLQPIPKGASVELVTTFDNCGAALSVRQDSTKQRMKVKEFFIVEKTW